MEPPAGFAPHRRCRGRRVSCPVVRAGLALGLNQTVAPSERITLGFIGIGMMGRGHMGLLLGYPQAHVLAVCDVDRWRLDDAKQTAEQAYAERANSGTYAGCAAYKDLRELIARQDIDAVVVATGDRWHALASVMAAESGKDVYCEKPANLTLHEAAHDDRPRAAVRLCFSDGTAAAQHSGVPVRL